MKLDTLFHQLTNKFIVKKKYKIIVPEKSLNDFIQKETLEENDDIKEVHISINNNIIHFFGISQQTRIFNNKKYNNVNFEISLKKSYIKKDKLFLKVVNTKLSIPTKKIDYYALLSKYTNRIQQEIVKTITEDSRNSIMLEKKWDIVYIDMKQFMTTVPKGIDFISNIKLLNYTFEQKNLILFIESNLLFKNMLSFFQSFISIHIEEIKWDTDITKLLLRK